VDVEEDAGAGTHAPFCEHECSAVQSATGAETTVVQCAPVHPVAHAQTMPAPVELAESPLAVC
jgi:hypothetical protein